MQKCLAPLKKKGMIDEWYDEELIPGDPINIKIREKLEKANIVIFLVSPDFLLSKPCMEEWKIAKKTSKDNRTKINFCYYQKM